MAEMTRGQLRNRVQTRLRDWKQQGWHPQEINDLLNEAQDEFSRDTEYLVTSNIQDITAAASPGAIVPPPYKIIPAAGYELIRILGLQLFDGSVYLDIDPWTQTQVEQFDPLYRLRTAGKPYRYIRDFDPSLGAGQGTPAVDTVWLYPASDTTYTAGLVARIAIATRNQMTSDSIPMALPYRMAGEALIAYTTAQCLLRGPKYGKLQKDPRPLIDYGLATWEKAKQNCARIKTAGYDKVPMRSRVYWK